MDREAIKDLVDTAVNETSGRTRHVIAYLAGQMKDEDAYLLEYLLSVTLKFDLEFESDQFIEGCNYVRNSE